MRFGSSLFRPKQKYGCNKQTHERVFMKKISLVLLLALAFSTTTFASVAAEKEVKKEEPKPTPVLPFGGVRGIRL